MTQPAPGSRWAHKRDRRVVVVVRVIPSPTPGGEFIAYRFERTAGGMGRDRSTPIQSMGIEIWRSIFTRPAP